MQRRAFTLIELLVVVFVMAIAAGMIVPRMGRSITGVGAMAG